MPKRTKKKRFTRLKTKHQIGRALEAFHKLPFVIGEEVLACWQDGLYYLAVVKTVCAAMLFCACCIYPD